MAILVQIKILQMISNSFLIFQMRSHLLSQNRNLKLNQRLRRNQNLNQRLKLKPNPSQNLNQKPSLRLNQNQPWRAEPLGRHVVSTSTAWTVPTSWWAWHVAARHVYTTTTHVTVARRSGTVSTMARTTSRPLSDGKRTGRQRSSSGRSSLPTVRQITVLLMTTCT